MLKCLILVWPNRHRKVAQIISQHVLWEHSGKQVDHLEVLPRCFCSAFASYSCRAFRYVAPEYAMTGHLLVKSDAYSYGVVLLELLTGRRPVDMSQPSGQENLVTWVRFLSALIFSCYCITFLYLNMDPLV